MRKLDRYHWKQWHGTRLINMRKVEIGESAKWQNWPMVSAADGRHQAIKEAKRQRGSCTRNESKQGSSNQEAPRKEASREAARARKKREAVKQQVCRCGRQSWVKLW